jgi:hypothetical protein
MIESIFISAKHRNTSGLAYHVVLDEPGEGILWIALGHVQDKVADGHSENDHLDDEVT